MGPMNAEGQPAAIVDEPQWAAFVAIDWADQKHVWKLQPAEVGGACEQGELEQTLEAIEV